MLGGSGGFPGWYRGGSSSSGPNRKRSREEEKLDEEEEEDEKEEVVLPKKKRKWDTWTKKDDLKEIEDVVEQAMKKKSEKNLHIPDTLVCQCDAHALRTGQHFSHILLFYPFSHLFKPSDKTNFDAVAKTWLLSRHGIDFDGQYRDPPRPSLLFGGVDSEEGRLAEAIKTHRRETLSGCMLQGLEQEKRNLLFCLNDALPTLPVVVNNIVREYTCACDMGWLLKQLLEPFQQKRLGEVAKETRQELEHAALVYERVEKQMKPFTLPHTIRITRSYGKGRKKTNRTHEIYDFLRVSWNEWTAVMTSPGSDSPRELLFKSSKPILGKEENRWLRWGHGDENPLYQIGTKNEPNPLTVLLHSCQPILGVKINLSP